MEDRKQLFHMASAKGKYKYLNTSTLPSIFSKINHHHKQTLHFDGLRTTAFGNRFAAV